MNRLRIATVAALLTCAIPAAAKEAVSCGGAAMLGGAQLNCSHVQPKAPPQFCTYSWALHTSAGDQKVVDGSFTLPPGASNVQVYQGSGFDSALSNPIVICRGSR
ncbi:MAG: hypothetical protein EOQ64_09375 [Mesorhizobium sp.]|uniref:hypothetical protein n=1 Tax=unclassified Mesorhizobium TaxID=325217 RepID=UPI000BAF4384|nr:MULTISPECIES: hypothetical protein [unclassified Mesorhizobium]PBB45637.1 hypothetical protein CK222_00340 [Mesorhizobium sp. WSM3866]RUV99829.1 hypothetical protein EOA49_18155 [Mesorhizobium sp. M1A.F.Ca.IN.020.04.1.1]RUW05815.1 hypothetical protein EOA53_24980 [Mesorhizobium sp. M1A.F.Ca.IN.020.03.1.1]RWF69618.1 MAG: hypothetical protein EOQ34_21495 [Mesorhizobium sp.]RWG13411.1 MAG: hypothetical protein EOQ58_17795 [Mesorhizobium sp.]